MSIEQHAREVRIGAFNLDEHVQALEIRAVSRVVSVDCQTERHVARTVVIYVYEIRPSCNIAGAVEKVFPNDVIMASIIRVWKTADLYNRD